MYNVYSEKRSYSQAVALVFGFLSILFAFIIPPTGIIMGGVGFIYERKSAKEKGERYNRLNLGLNGIGVILGTLKFLYILIFKMGLFFG